MFVCCSLLPPSILHILFADDKIEASYKGQHKDFEYGEIMRVTCTDQAIYLWLNDTVAMQIPVRAFESEQDMHKLLTGNNIEPAKLELNYFAYKSIKSAVWVICSIVVIAGLLSPFINPLYPKPE